jgi:Zn-dependent peptidase ImmA (M78 family)
MVAAMDADLAPRCFEFARELSQLYLNSTPPYSLKPLVEHFGVCDIRERPLDRDACLISESGRLFIDVNSLYPLVRKRLSIAHEIGHLIVERCSPERTTLGIDEDPGIEGLCNRLAAQLLAPDWALRRSLSSERAFSNWQIPIRCATVLRAASEFGISVDAIASRIFSELSWAQETVSVIWRYSENSARPGSEEALRVASTWHSKQTKVYVPRNKTAPQGSAIRRASEQTGVFCANEDVSLGTLRGQFTVEAAGFGTQRNMENRASVRSVLSLFSPLPSHPASGDHHPPN